MPQMLRLSQGHWLNLDSISEVLTSHDNHLVVLCWGENSVRLQDAERDCLLAWLASQSQVWNVGTAPANDACPGAPSGDEPPF